MMTDSPGPLRTRRFFAGITQVELARRAGINHVTVSLLERGKCKDTQPTRKVQRKIAAVLNVTVEELFPSQEK